MPQQDIKFKTSDHVILRGWLYTPDSSIDGKLPCLIMSHGFSALKEMALDKFAEASVGELPVSCLVYDNRSFGSSDCAPNQPQHEIIPSVQIAEIADIQDAITYAQSLDIVDANKIGIWGSFYSAGHCLQVGACDRRVKACISRAPMANGWKGFHRLIQPDIIYNLNKVFQDDRSARVAGQNAATIPVIAKDPLQICALASSDSYNFFSAWEGISGWKNEVTVRSAEVLRAYDPSHHISHISPTPLLMLVADEDHVTPTDIGLKAYAQALEPKKLVILSGGHYDVYREPNMSHSVAEQVKFLKENLCTAQPVRSI